MRDIFSFLCAPFRWIGNIFAYPFRGSKETRLIKQNANITSTIQKTINNNDLMLVMLESKVTGIQDHAEYVALKNKQAMLKTAHPVNDSVALDRFTLAMKMNKDARLAELQAIVDDNLKVEEQLQGIKNSLKQIRNMYTSMTSPVTQVVVERESNFIENVRVVSMIVSMVGFVASLLFGREVAA